MNSVGPVMASYKASGVTGVKSEVRARAVNTAVCATKRLAIPAAKYIAIDFSNLKINIKK